MYHSADEPSAALREALEAIAARQLEMTVEMTSLADSLNRQAHGEVAHLERSVRSESARTRRELAARIDTAATVPVLRIDLLTRRLLAGLIVGQVVVAVEVTIAVALAAGS